jgi:1,4-dihydroxy-2-naphthoate octaprenyltransferase
VSGVLGLVLRATRAPSLVAGAMPALVLTALVAHQGYPVDGARFAATLIGLVLLQAGVNLVNDFFDDASGLDADPAFEKNPFPLGSRVIQSGELTRRGVLALAAACFAGGAACGLWLDTLHPGHVVLALGATGFLLGYFYTAPPLRISYHGAGEPVTFLLFGPLAGLGTYYVQTGHFDAVAAFVSCIVGILVMAILFLHHFPQHDADARHRKQTPVVRLGPAGAGRLVPAMLTLPYLLVAAGVGLAWLPPFALAFFLSAPLAVAASRTALRQAGDARAMTRAFGQVAGLNLFGGLLLAGGIWLG